MEGLGEGGGEDGAEDGCIFWTDAEGIRWSKDVNGFYGGTAGSLSYVSFVACPDEYEAGGAGVEEVWVSYDTTSAGAAGAAEDWGMGGKYTFAARGGAGYRHEDELEVGGGGDGAIYWRDEEGTAWCRDRRGVYGGGQGAEYHSIDGGSVWYGKGESWVEFTGDALEFIGTTTVRKLQAKSSRSTYSKYSSSSAYSVSSSFKPPPFPLAAGSSGVVGVERKVGPKLDDGAGEEGARDDGSQHVWENERGVLQAPCNNAEDARYVELYGGCKAGMAAAERVKAEEARLNAAFDRAIRSASAPMWPQMPLRF